MNRSTQLDESVDSAACGSKPGACASSMVVPATVAEASAHARFDTAQLEGGGTVVVNNLTLQASYGRLMFPTLVASHLLFVLFIRQGLRPSGRGLSAVALAVFVLLLPTLVAGQAVTDTARSRL